LYRTIDIRPMVQAMERNRA